jgi:glycosyltransferase involved in cell wall biosynthesis
MRVVFVNNFAHLTGGADQHCFELASVLRERDHEVAYLATEDAANVEHEGVFVPCRVSHTTRESLSRRRQAQALAGALWNRDAAAAMNRLVDEFRPDVVHAHKLYPQLSVAPIVTAARRGVPVVQTLHDFELVSASAIDARGGRLDRDETRFRFRLANSSTYPIRTRVHVPRVSAFIAVSRFVARVYAAHGVVADVMPNFVSSAAIGEGLPFHDRDGVLYFGRLREEKGVVDVVRIAELLPHLMVRVVGSGSLEGFVRSAAERLPNLHVTGHVPNRELMGIVRRARVVVIPSRCQDAGPLVPLESFATATPVVAYANGGLAEYVIDSGGGRVVPADPEALAAVVAELHDDEGSWLAHSRRGLEAVVDHHTTDGYVPRLEEIYRRVAHTRPTAPLTSAGSLREPAAVPGSGVDDAHRSSRRE